MKKRLKFSVLPYRENLPKSARWRAYLKTDGWNDWFKFTTMYVLVIFDATGAEHRIGEVKIGQFGMSKQTPQPDLPASFVRLGDQFFSVGQDRSYYEELTKLGENVRADVLTALRDVAYDQDLFRAAIDEDVMRNSLLRSVTARSVRGQFNRLARGGARLSQFDFSYTLPPEVDSKNPPLKLSFEVIPEAQPPTNIHVIIGRNGVGKTFVLDRMARALTRRGASKRRVGTFTFAGEEAGAGTIANVVSVTFSAFDPFGPLMSRTDGPDAIKYEYVGLKQSPKSGSRTSKPKSPGALLKEFVDSAWACRLPTKAVRWRRAVELLKADPMFEQNQASAVMDEETEDEFRERAESLFQDLSSGHKIVLLTVTRLIEVVEERTLVLIDEPEAHLHPPLLSAFVRALSDLLVNRNGVAIIATHSPVILQEVPRRCVWKLNRLGLEASAMRPEIETFGENVGILTREIFGFEVTQSGFHRLLQEAVSESASYEEALDRFDNQLGAEARAIVRGLVAERDASEGVEP